MIEISKSELFFTCINLILILTITTGLILLIYFLIKKLIDYYKK